MTLLARLRDRLLARESAPARARFASLLSFSPECFEASLAATTAPWSAFDALPSGRGRRPAVLVVLPANTPAPFLATLPHLVACAGEATLKLPSRGPSPEASFEGWVLRESRAAARETRAPEARGAIERIRLDRWGGGEAAEAEWAERVDAIVVFGGDEAVARWRSLAPEKTIGYGERFSLALVGRGADFNEAARRAARDLVLWEGRGCLSPQAVLVEEDEGDDRAVSFARALAAEMESIERSLPAPRRDKAASGAALSFRAAASARPGGRVWGPNDFSWTVVYDPRPIEAAPIETPPLVRVAVVRPVRKPARLAASLGVLALRCEAVGVSPAPPSGADLPEHVFLPLGEMQAPPLTRRHGGLPPLAELLAGLGRGAGLGAGREGGTRAASA